MYIERKNSINNKKNIKKNKSKKTPLKINKDSQFTDLENDFKNFCNDQESKPPSFNQIYEETNDWINEFNNEFQTKIYN